MAEIFISKTNSAIVIHEIKPPSGTLEGGTNVHVLAKIPVNTSEIRCHFGDLVVNAMRIELEEIFSSLTCVSPNMSLNITGNNLVRLEISVNGGNDLSSSKHDFLYYPSPLLYNITPSSGY